MSSTYEERLQAVGKATLTPLVRRAVEIENLAITDWDRQPVDGGFGESYGVTRFHGSALMRDKSLNWSLILKATGPKFGSQEPTAWDYWKREVLMVQSGLLDDLPGGLTAPSCFGIEEYPDGQVWLWLEDLPGNEDQKWSFGQYNLAARHLGQYNGAYLTSRVYPNLDWLSTGQLRAWVGAAQESVQALPGLKELAVFAGLAPSVKRLHLFLRSIYASKRLSSTRSLTLIEPFLQAM